MSKLLLQHEMIKHLNAGDFRLAFIGMSNCGKSYRSRILQANAGFFWYEVDREIQKSLGFNNMDEISAWMGDPTIKGFSEREVIYLEKEEECTYLEGLDTGGKNLVFDTTGSVIYLSDTTKNWLKDHCLIVHIDVGTGEIPLMLERYIQEPKPVSWDGMLEKREGESHQESLRRCYPLLLEDRLKKYKNISHITIPASELKDLSANETLKVIQSYLPK